MSVETAAWIVSVGGALAFLAGGYIMGRLGARRQIAAVGADLGVTAAPEPTLPPAPEPAQPPAPEPAAAEEAPSHATVLLEVMSDDDMHTGDDTTTLAPAVSGFREENLSQLLGGLDADGSLVAVLGDDRGLPLAVWGPDSDANILAAVGAHAAILSARLADVAPDAPADRLDIRLGDGRTFQARPLSGSGQTFFVISLGETVPGDDRFAAVKAQLAQTLKGDPA
ncbi:MAG: hypothetical protein CSA66_05955 [Proteobacteria bacterium]|nr:MAG: hypothetical protein CSA66_05955 [Pseudomonadota bacterium]